MFDTVLPCGHLIGAGNESELIMKFRCGKDTGENAEIAFPDPGGLYLPPKLKCRIRTPGGVPQPEKTVSIIYRVYLIPQTSGIFVTDWLPERHLRHVVLC
jgi:hypothetical protein